MFRFLTILLFIGSLLAYFPKAEAQKRNNQPKGTQANKEGIIKSDGWLSGSYYYPEHWPKERWEKDLKLLKAQGYDFTHFAEFAWAAMEPEEGKFRFGWLDTAITIAEKVGLKVILCTPSPCPPAWMATKYPDILSQNQYGQLYRHGSRQQGSWSSERFRKFVATINDSLGRRYGNRSSVIGWQLENEPSHYGKIDFSENAQEAFRRYLKNKYKTLSALNKAWGTSFWSLTYSDWGQIRLPNELELVQQPNPAAVLEMHRFQNVEVAEWLKLQATTLRKHIKNGAWITTNMMEVTHQFQPNPFLMRDFLDFPTYTLYPACGYGNEMQAAGEEAFRVGNPYFMAFQHDMFEAVSGRTGVMELQPGQVNWGPYNPLTLPKVVSNWVKFTYALGVNLTCNYRLDQPNFGGEIMYEAVTYSDGQTLRRGGKEFSEAVQWLNKEKDHSHRPIKAEVGYLWHHDNLLELVANRQNKQWSPQEHYLKWYTLIKRHKQKIAFVSAEDDFSNYKVLVAPAYALMDFSLLKKLEQYAQNGGVVVFSIRSGLKDLDAQLHIGDGLATPLANLAGIRIEAADQTSRSKTGKLKLADGKEGSFSLWAELLETKPNTRTLATYNSMFYKGMAAATLRPLGKGAVIYCGAESTDNALEISILQEAFKQAKLNFTFLPEGVFYERRNSKTYIFNFGVEDYTFPAEPKLWHTPKQKVLKQMDVAVVEE